MANDPLAGLNLHFDQRDPASMQAYQALVRYIVSLPGSQQQTAVNFIQQTLKSQEGEIGGFPVGDPGALFSLSAAQIKGLQAQVTTKINSTPAPTTEQGKITQQANQTQQQAVTAATPTTAQLPEQTVGNVAPGIPVIGGAGATIPGTTKPADFNNLLQDYYSTAFAQAGGNVNQLAQLAGMDPQLLQSQYQAYMAGMTKAFAGAPQGVGAFTPLSLEQFAQNKAQTKMGPWAAVLESIEGIWTSQTNSPMPPDLINSVITALNGMPQSQQENVLYEASLYMSNKANAFANKGLFDQTGTLASAILGALPSSILGYSPTGGTGTDTGSFTSAGIVGTALQSAPFLVKQQTTSAIDSAFESALHRAPTAADLAALGPTPTDVQIKQYIDNQPVSGTGMTYGAYSTASSNLTTLWESYFGHAPSLAELKWSVGKSPEDIQSFINDSHSSIPGITIGQKNDYETFIDGLDRGTSSTQGGTHGLSAQIDDSLMQQLHNQVTKASTGTTTPGKM